MKLKLQRKQLEKEKKTDKTPVRSKVLDLC